MLNVTGDSVIDFVEVDAYGEGVYEVLVGEWSSFVKNVTDWVRGALRFAGAHVIGVGVTRNDSRREVIISFAVDNRVWSDGRVTAGFLWFLSAWGLDFIESGFNETNEGLTWSGELGGVPITVVVRVPEQRGPYTAWGEPYGHCHGRVWWLKG